MEAAPEHATENDVGIEPGDLIADRYRVVRVIGRGGMGLILEAMHEALGQRVAIKVLRHQGADHAEATARFLAEARALGQLNTRHFPRVTDVATIHEDTPYFVMEYLDGRDLAAVLSADGPLSVETATDYALQVCEALAEAYAAGIVHRDIKPSNLFITHASDGSPLLKVLDLGISKFTSEGDPTVPSLTQTGIVAMMGSPRYMAPEQMRSTKRVDHRADIWSLGVVLHESLTGERPFVGETFPDLCAAISADDPVRVRQVRRDVPIELQDVILRCLAKDPEQRFADVGVLARELAPFAPPDAAVAARRVARIIGAASDDGPPSANPAILAASVAPPRSSFLPAPLPPPAPLPSSPSMPAMDEPDPLAFADSDPVPRALSLAPTAPTGQRPLRGWALAVVAVVAIPAFILGAWLQPVAPTASTPTTPMPSAASSIPAQTSPPTPSP